MLAGEANTKGGVGNMAAQGIMTMTEVAQTNTGSFELHENLILVFGINFVQYLILGESAFLIALVFLSYKLIFFFFPKL